MGGVQNSRLDKSGGWKILETINIHHIHLIEQFFQNKQQKDMLAWHAFLIIKNKRAHLLWHPSTHPLRKKQKKTVFWRTLEAHHLVATKNPNETQGPWSRPRGVGQRPLETAWFLLLDSFCWKLLLLKFEVWRLKVRFAFFCGRILVKWCFLFSKR